MGILVIAGGSLSPDVLAHMRTSSAFAGGLVLGTLAGAGAIAAGLEIAVPGAPARRTLLALPMLLLVGWLGLLFIEIGGGFDVGLGGAGAGARSERGAPSLPGTPGRFLCPLQVLLFALVPLAIAWVQITRRVPVGSTSVSAGAAVGASALAGLAAGLVAAIWMQLACVADPLHTLTHHLSPLLILTPLGALVGAITAWPMLRDRL